MANKPRSLTRPILPPLQTNRSPGRNGALKVTQNDPNGSLVTPLPSETVQVLPAPVYFSTRNGARGSYDQAMIQRLDQRGPIPEYITSPSLSGSNSSPLFPQPVASPQLTPSSPQYGLRAAGLPQPHPQQDPCGVSHPAPRSTVSRTGCALSARLLHQDPGRDPKELLQAWAQVFFGNMLSADAFVVALSLRRSRNSSDAHHASRTPSPVSPMDDVPGQLRLSAFIRPQDPKKPATLIKRVFNMDELRALLPATSPSTARGVRRTALAHLSRRGQPGSAKSHEALAARAVKGDTRPKGMSPKRDPAATPIREFFIPLHVHQWPRRANRFDRFGIRESVFAHPRSLAHGQPREEG